MAVFPKQNAILLQVLHHFTAHTLLFKVRFQHRTSHSFWKPGRYGIALFLKNSQMNIDKHILNLLFHFLRYSWL